jgi:hypothetical protein
MFYGLPLFVPNRVVQSKFHTLPILLYTSSAQAPVGYIPYQSAYGSSEWQQYSSIAAVAKKKLMAKGMKNLWRKYGFRINYVMGKSIWTIP